MIDKPKCLSSAVSAIRSKFPAPLKVSDWWIFILTVKIFSKHLCRFISRQEILTKMIMTPSSFTLEHLSSLKFKELQKLSAQYQVNKRWAKKQELIDNLLALKKKNEEENQWRDGSIIVNDLKPNNEIEVNKRLTFNVEKENKESHLTFDVPQNGKSLLSEVNSRETYDIPPNMSVLGVQGITDPRATFDIPCKEKLLDVDPRATFDIPQTGNLLKGEIIGGKNLKKNSKKLNCETRQENMVNATLVQGLKKLTFDISFKNREEKNDKSQSQIKTLTIPCLRVPKRSRKDEVSKNDSTPIKMSSRSINIKKSTRLPISKNNLIRSPAISSIKKSANKQNINSLTIPQDMNMEQQQSSRIDPVIVGNKLINTTKNIDDSYKEKVKTILRKGQSKPENFLNEKFHSNKVNFATPPQSISKASRVLPLKKTPLRRENEKKSGVLRQITQTPCHIATADFQKGANGNVSKKPITAKKMPDFTKIHKKQFEQMDSLHDYIKKKEERIRKLFGTPQPGQQLQAFNKSEPVFHFKSSESKKGVNGREGLKNALTLSKKKENTISQKEALKSKLPSSKSRKDVKDENRSHIHGVRTNKRFELQMKFRNI